MRSYAVLAFVAGALAGSCADAQEIHTFHCLHGCPVGTPATNDLIVREIYSLSSNDVTKFADWVAYRVTPETIGSTEDRHWAPDPWLEDEETLEADDYDGAHAALTTDRGHQAPLAAFTGTPFWRDTNFLSNITPQGSGLNRGPWMRLEGAVRDLASDGATVYVITGPLYEGNTVRMPAAEPHVVPSGYWKIIASEEGSVSSFIFPQDAPQSGDFCDYQVNIDEVELRSRLNLFPRLAVQSLTNDGSLVGCVDGG